MELPKAVIKWTSIVFAVLVFGVMFYQCFIY